MLGHSSGHLSPSCCPSDKSSFLLPAAPSCQPGKMHSCPMPQFPHPLHGAGMRSAMPMPIS